jgi:hypothetical protein
MKFVQFLGAAALLAGSAAGAAVVTVSDSSGPWLGFMNVFELPSNGGGYVFGSGWGVSDLVANFNDGAGQLTLAPNSVNDPSTFWYQGGGGPGHPGNKIMDANLYIESTGGLSGQLLTFQGDVLSNTFTSAHQARIFIRDFAPDYSSVVESSISLTPGPFSVSLFTLPGATRHVQYGFQVRGENVWITDVAPFGTAVIATPAPGSLALLAMTGLMAARRRR